MEVMTTEVLREDIETVFSRYTTRDYAKIRNNLLYVVRVKDSLGSIRWRQTER